jgi:hypothetical protein
MSDTKNNRLLTKGQKVLQWIYSRTKKGLRASAFGSFKANRDTSFRTHISVLGHSHNLEIPREYVKNPNTGMTYKEYWLSEEDILKVEKILKTYP